MDKYINQQTLQNALERKQCGPANKRYTEGWNDCLLQVKSMVRKAPAVNVAPVVHGRWIYDKKAQRPYCSVCKEYFYGATNSPMSYCSNCGAKMDGGNENV